MKAAFLDEAAPEDVSHAVRDVLERRGALVHEHRHSRVRFRGRPSTRFSWAREGYVGIYQHAGERDVEIRLLLRARWPWRILMGVAVLNLLMAAATVALDPPGTVWVLVAILGFFLLVAAGIVYVNTLKRVREEERDLMAALESEVAARIAEARLVSDAEREAAEADARLAAEIEERRIHAQRRAEPAPPRKASRFSLRPGRKAAAREEAPPEPAAEAAAPATEESPEERRARLLARKAELERQRRGE